MLKDMEQWTAVRHALFVEKISLREAARRFRLNFRTIQKIYNNDAPADYERVGGETKITPFLPFLEKSLEEDKALPRKQRHTAKRLYERLRDEHHYPYTYRTVCHALQKLREKEKPLFMPLAHPPGQAQFDFGFAYAIIGGRSQQVAYAVISLPYSNVRYVQAFPRECTETFQESLKRFFHFLGGVPTRITFDNSRVNVAKIVGCRGDTPSYGLLQLESCYLFQHHFCRVRQPQEKGHVENAVEYVRNNFMVPLPEFLDFAAFNAFLERKCREEFTKTSAMKNKTIGEFFSEEKSSLLPLPETDFEARRVEVRHANSLSLVRFDRNDYSVPGDHAYKEFTVVGSVDTVKFLTDGEVVAVHERDWGAKATHYNPIHYLSIASRRPNGLDFGAPFSAWHLPNEFEVLRRRLESQAGHQGKREYIRILRLLERFSLEQLTHGLARALDSNTTAYDGVRLYVECEATVSVELFSLDGRPHLQHVKLPEPDMTAYLTLLEDNIYEKDGNEANGLVETSFDAIEAAGLRAGLRGDGDALRDRECGSPGLFTPIIGTGTPGPGSPRGGTTVESGAISKFENAGGFRFSCATELEQDACEPVDARGVH
jgi:transposase